MTVSADEFLRRFLLHLLPRGFMRIRHFGHSCQPMPCATDCSLPSTIGRSITAMGVHRSVRQRKPQSGPARIAADRWLSSNASMLSKSACELLIGVALLIRHKHASDTPNSIDSSYTRLTCVRETSQSPEPPSHARACAFKQPMPSVLRPTTRHQYSRNGNSALKAQQNSCKAHRPRPPQTRAGHFKRLYRNRPGPGCTSRPRFILRVGSDKELTFSVPNATPARN